MNPVFFFNQPPPLKKVFLSAGNKKKQAICLCDKSFQFHPLLKKWREHKNIQFYYLPPGEKSKSLERLSFHIKKIQSLNKDFDKDSLFFISLGGGSVIDLTGFLASIYKRGLPVIHFPTTWLSAFDSAHGGKTALNFQNVKNLLGTYHFPQAVFIIKAFLKQNPKTLKQSAWGELLKIALIEGGEFYNNLKKEQTKLSLEKYLKPAVQAKMKLVAKDPYERKRIRKKLNLGHTVGHILEALYPLPHGHAILQGLWFSLEWSFYKDFMSEKKYEAVKTLLPKRKRNKSFPVSLFQKHLRQDKKHKSDQQLDFVFIQKPGSVFIQTVKEKELLAEAKRQGLI